MRPPGEKTYLQPWGNAALWYAFLGAPIVWAIDLFLVWFAVSPACVTQNSLPLYLIDGTALLLSLASGWTGYLIWKDTGEEMPGEHATRTDRSRLMAVVGAMMSGLFSLIIAGHILATIIIGPCIPLPRVRMTPDAMRTIEAPMLASTDVSESR